MDRWFESDFNVSIHVDAHVKRELRRYQLREDRDILRIKRDMDEQVEREVAAAMEADGRPDAAEDDPRADKAGREEDRQGVRRQVSKTKDGVDSISGGTLGIVEEAPKPSQEIERTQYLDDDGKELKLDEEGDLAGKVLESLLKVDEETIC